eukprot:g3262.t1
MEGDSATEFTESISKSSDGRYQRSRVQSVVILKNPDDHSHESGSLQENSEPFDVLKRDSDTESVNSFKSSQSGRSEMSMTEGAATKRWEKMARNSQEEVSLESPVAGRRGSLQDTFKRQLTIVENFMKGDAKNILGPSSVHLPNSVDTIKTWDCNPMLLKVNDLRAFTMAMFDHLQLFQRFKVDIDLFSKFMKLIQGAHKFVPYHSYTHTFDVTQTMFLILTDTCATMYLESIDVLSLMYACIGHSLGNPGLTNSFLMKSMSALSITYNDMSALQNLASATFFRIVRDTELAQLQEDEDYTTDDLLLAYVRGRKKKLMKRGILCQLDDGDFRRCRRRIISTILNTDMAYHFDLMTSFEQAIESKSITKAVFCGILCHVCTISNQARPFAVAQSWAALVEEEFFIQGDKEKRLEMKVSPFMNRKKRNLPRMQVGFIDAVCLPIFRSLTKLLPRLQSRVEIITKNREKYRQLLEERNKKGEVSPSISTRTDSIPTDGSNVLTTTFRVTENNIPGISVDRTTSRIDKRRGSIVQMSISPKSVSRRSSSADLSRGSKVVPAMREFYDEKEVTIKSRIRSFLRNPWTQAFVLIVTIYALFGDDMRIAWLPKSVDDVFGALSLLAIIVFAVEITLNLYVDGKEYMEFYFWLDVVATLSIVPDLTFLYPQLQLESYINATVAESQGTTVQGTTTLRAARAARAGTRVGRVVRLLRIARIFKVYGSVIKNREDDMGDDDDEEAPSSISRVGHRLLGAVSKKVILAVLSMMLFSIIFDVYATDNSPLHGLVSLISLHALGNGTDMYFNISLQDYVKSIDANQNRLIYLEIGNTTYYQASSEVMSTIRLSEILRFPELSPDNQLENQKLTPHLNYINSSFAFYNNKHNTVALGKQSMILTLIVIIVLVGISFLLTKDANDIVIVPIEKMVATVNKLCTNPFDVVEKNTLKKQLALSGNKEMDETQHLQQSILKMGELLVVAFGKAGSAIISRNLGTNFGFDAQLPGRRCRAIFGFMDIRKFTQATEVLQEDVMIFVNSVAIIVHNCVTACGGDPNKNIGDAFLIVWRLKYETKEEASKLSWKTDSPRGQERAISSQSIRESESIRPKQPTASDDTSTLTKGSDGLDEMKIFDLALQSFLQIGEQINGSQALNNLLSNPKLQGGLADFETTLGYGLHYGWAIEGTIGSQHKVEASYLSPHVNLAARLESATKQYRVKLLFSGNFFIKLSGRFSKKCRLVDRACLKGTRRPTGKSLLSFLSSTNS